MSGNRRRRGTNRTTMTDVARMAGVAPSTVSLYLRAPEEVSPKLGTRVQKAIDSLNYVPNLMAGALAATRTRVVGVVVPSIVNSFFADTVTALQARLWAENYQMLIGHTDYDPETEEQLVRTFLSWSPGAMVLTGLHHSRTTRRMLEATDIPVVEMWELGPQPIDRLVGFSHGDVGRMQARHLIENGAREIAFIGARLERDQRAAQRAEGYAETLRSHSEMAPPEIIDIGHEASTAAAGATFAELLRRRPSVDGIVFSNDLLALGALFEAQRSRIAVPDRVALIGFGDLDFGRDSVPALSTVAPPRTDIGERVADQILAGPDSGDEGRIRIDLGFELTVRESSARGAISAISGRHDNAPAR
ncbi:LacI family DNA-binding transcriptional regulator [Chelativorans sp. YIM 93263]|uniref:LacI family DNA-binding transcriptional regulator n=1 Tax=Chelativorans sp. YIM 93263 TaxID=2906648 RepID=UPI00237917A0|nr:LacI family DNA-binding transcriptional regulator [Chelativorans sp. YIM 93263]